MKKLISGLNRVELYLLKSLLESEGIACFLKNEYPPAAGELPPLLATPELWIADSSQYEQAILLIQENSPVSHAVDSWQCPGCHEKLEGQFTNCWHCGTQKP